MSIITEFQKDPYTRNKRVVYYRVTKVTKKKNQEKNAGGLQNHEPKPLLPTNNQATRTTVRRSWVRPEMQLSVLPEGRPPGPQHARNRPEKKQKSRPKSVGGGSTRKMNSNKEQCMHT